MDENFEKFKRKILKEHLIKSIVYGCSFAIALVSVASIFFKRVVGHVHILIYIAVGIALSVGFTFLFYRREKPNDQTIAKRLDRKFAMNEKVQTMVEYLNREDEMVRKQRETTEDELKTISIKRLPIRLAAATILTFVVSLGICTSSFFVKEKTRPVNPISSESSSFSSSESVSSNPVEIGTSHPTEDEKDIFDELIDAVDRSPLSDATKEDIKEELGALQDRLEDATEEEKDELIEETKDRIDQMLEEELSKNKIGAELKKSSVEILRQIGEALIGSDVDLLASAFGMLKESMTESSFDSLIALIELYCEEIQTALINSQVDAEDELYACFQNLIDSLREVKTRLQEQSVDRTEERENISVMIDETLKKLIDLLTKQKEIEELKEAIDEALDSLSPSSGDGESDEEGEGEKGENSEGDTGDGDEKTDDSDEKDGDNPQGSGGNGDAVYGNNDQVYTKDGDTTEYGNVIDDYYSDIVNDGDDGVPDDIGDIINDYFNSLYGDGEEEGE